MMKILTKFIGKIISTFLPREIKSSRTFKSLKRKLKAMFLEKIYLPIIDYPCIIYIRLIKYYSVILENGN